MRAEQEIRERLQFYQDLLASATTDALIDFCCVALIELGWVLAGEADGVTLKFGEDGE